MKEPGQPALLAAEAICASCGSQAGGIRVVSTALERLVLSADEKAAIVEALQAIHDAIGGITEENSMGGQDCATRHERSVIERSLSVLGKHGWKRTE